MQLEKAAAKKAWVSHFVFADVFVTVPASTCLPSFLRRRLAADCYGFQQEFYLVEKCQISEGGQTW